ncbi:double-strand break repair protein AddB [Thalassovita taeanensis]|uniref:Double-strand break repair protein AddB n=1 Tax=Thalassovita taeanensis TaxID=657014 RepID=A0A1H9JIB1_9RHOB|nr:double-strand break repair protein AddB [Thalassovita taeanensis]SEQ86537.1 double-strand break repair protein AddB [Thalassovita taeanensis]
MFEPSGKPRVFGVPAGADFPAVLVQGLMLAQTGMPPDALARVRFLVNTRRMARRIRDLFDAGPALLLPQVELVTGPAPDILSAAIPSAAPPLRRRLEIAQLASTLLDSQPDLAPRASLYDLADSLAELMSELHSEGVAPDVLRQLDVSDESGHWKRALSFLGIVQHYFGETEEAPDGETRQRRVIESLCAQWQLEPPSEPVIVAGSTGSRGTTMLLMKAVASLPQGAIILPGYDFDMPHAAWKDLDEALTAEDHPQYRFRKLMVELGIEPSDVRRWGETPPPNPARNRLVSLALRPAPVTDQWLSDGPHLHDLPSAMKDVTMIEAPSKRDEALAIALRLRQAAEEGQTAALITPDRMLTRQVSSALDRWNIVPDDSAGTPLQLSPPGRFLRHISALFHQKLTAEALLTLLMHPLTHSGSDRGPHLLLTRELELFIRRKGVPFPDAETLLAWGAAHKHEYAVGWAEWIVRCFVGKDTSEPERLAVRLSAHLDLAEMIARGGKHAETSELWKEDAGRKAQETVQELQREAEYGGQMSARDYADLFGAILSRAEVRNPDTPHPGILIWGTLEARVQGADLVILGGLNEGSWPEMPAPDPWLNRRMRFDAGLLLPERRIGLSAHDFQQAIGAREVWLTRSVRSDDAETVASRWLNRMTNLLSGLPDQGGPDALGAAKRRGQHWLAMARKLEEPGQTPAAPRPSPRPPVGARPSKLSVTEIKRLIRDPYAIYARHVLRLRPLDPLMSAPDALLRGIVTHAILERFIRDTLTDTSALTSERLLALSDAVLTENVPWSDARALWAARIARIAEPFVASEHSRRLLATPTYFEERAELSLDGLNFTLVGRADRIDMDQTGRAHIYDYKTGAPPTQPQQIKFDVQLLLEAAMLEQGGFRAIGPAEVARAVFIGLGGGVKEVLAPLEEESADRIWTRFEKLIGAYFTPEQGYTARRALFRDTDISDYDQLSRFGEWDITTDPTPEELS